MERDRIIDKGTIAGAALLAVATLGIVDTKLYIPPAITTPAGIIYLYDKDNQQVQAHEQVHWDRYQSGELDFWKYLMDKRYRCKEEIVANAQTGIYPHDSHPACSY